MYLHIYFENFRKGMNNSTRGSRRSPLWKDIFKTGKARNKSNENQSSNKLAIPQELENLMKTKKVRQVTYILNIYQRDFSGVFAKRKCFITFRSFNHFTVFRTAKIWNRLQPQQQ